MNEQQDISDSTIEIVEDQARELQRQLFLMSGAKTTKGISYSQYKAIYVIDQFGPVSIGTLERLVGSAQSTTSEMVARLTKEGLVAKVREALDGRVIRVALTDEGKRVLEQRRAEIRENYRILLEQFSADHRGQFLSCLKDLNQLLASFLQ